MSVCLVVFVIFISLPLLFPVNVVVSCFFFFWLIFIFIWFGSNTEDAVAVVDVAVLVANDVDDDVELIFLQD